MGKVMSSASHAIALPLLDTVGARGKETRTASSIARRARDETR
jgi:hypothetical protein